jgi:cyclase
MYRPRIIPVVLINAFGEAVKTINFNKRIYLGDPVNTVSLFNSFKVDELVLLNIDSYEKKFEINYELLFDISQEAKMPFAIGGGIESLEQIRRILSLGAEKVVLSKAAIERPSFLREAVNRFGSSSITVCLDVKKNFFGNYVVYIHKKKISLALNECLDLINENQAGELIIQSISEDGKMNGYDAGLVQHVSEYMPIPVVALGGASSLGNISTLISETYASAFAAGSIFVFQNNNRGVLVNYPSEKDLQDLCIM